MLKSVSTKVIKAQLPGMAVQSLSALAVVAACIISVGLIENSMREARAESGRLTSAKHEVARLQNDLQSQELLTKQANEEKEKLTEVLGSLTSSTSGSMQDVTSARRYLQNDSVEKLELAKLRSENELLQNNIASLKATSIQYEQETRKLNERLIASSNERSRLASEIADLRRRKVTDLQGGTLTADLSRNADVEELVRNCALLGSAENAAHQFRSAEKLFDRALVVYGDEKDSTWLSLRFNLARTLLEMGKLSEARLAFQECLELSTKLHDESVEASSLWNLGYLANSRKDYLQAVVLYKRALTVINEEKDPRNYAAVLHGLADTYKALGDKENSLRFAVKAGMLMEPKIKFHGNR